MTEDEARVQTDLREVVTDLATVCLRLEAIYYRLPEPPHADAMLLREEENDLATVVRQVIASALADHLVPAGRDLQCAALPGDVPVASFAGELPRAFVADGRAVSLLVGVVTKRVTERGGCILDLREFGLSPQTAREIAARAGLSVSVGMKAVFAWNAEEAACQG